MVIIIIDKLSSLGYGRSLWARVDQNQSIVIKQVGYYVYNRRHIRFTLAVMSVRESEDGPIELNLIFHSRHVY